MLAAMGLIRLLGEANRFGRRGNPLGPSARVEVEVRSEEKEC